MKKISLDNKNLQKNFKKLKKFYKKLPETKGCMENINKKDGCGGWCCKFQCPPFLYVEFLHAWNHIVNTWSTNDILDLIEKCLKTHLSMDITKGCVLWNEDTKLCRCHTVRPFNCYIYGITPDHEIKPRIEKMRELYGKYPDVVIRDQCDLVETVNGEKVKSTDDWWREICFIEENIGIPLNKIKNSQDGSYLLFHDHLILYLCSDKALSLLPKKLDEVDEYMDNVRKNFKNLKDKTKNEN